MRFGGNSRLAWAIALASVALWAAAAPATLGSFGRQEAEAPAASSPVVQDLGATEETGTPPSYQAQEATATEQTDVAPQETDSAAEPAPPQMAGELQCEAEPITLAANPDDTAPAAPQPPSEDPSGNEATFHLCGGPDPEAERAIEQLIDGRSFKAKLVSRGDGCADLTITVSPQSSAGSLIGRQSTQMNVSTGSGGVISVQIVTENGVTRAAINEPLPAGPAASATPTPTATPVSTATPTPPPAAQSPSVDSSTGEATFRLCGGADPQAERAIEQLVNGRNFRSRLVSRGDGCADLTITVSPQSSAGSVIGRQSTQMNVSTGSGGVISVQIVTENGVTKARIGAAR